MVKLQSRLERRLPTGCIEIPVALPGIRVFVRARPPRVDLLYSCPHCGETSRGAQEAGNEVKGEKARRTRSRQRPSNEMVSLKRDRGNVQILLTIIQRSQFFHGIARAISISWGRGWARMYRSIRTRGRGERMGRVLSREIKDKLADWPTFFQFVANDNETFRRRMSDSKLR